MAAYYNFGIELEMIVKPHTERDFQKYCGSKEKRLAYWIGYYERLARAMIGQGLQAKARPSWTMRRPSNLEGWFITSDASLLDEDRNVLEPPWGKFTSVGPPESVC